MKQRNWNIDSNDNTLFVTEQCNNRCLMCCQPPAMSNDIDVLYHRNLARLKNAPQNLKVIGITGGEPTLMGDKLIELIKAIRTLLPNTEIQMLSNGRNFSDNKYAKAVAEAAEGYMFVGVPFHSDYERDHDIIAGAKGAYQETIRGMFNLAAEGVAIELRIVMNRLNYMRLLPMSEFIFKNLSFVSWTAFMGMEYIGTAVKNNKTIWIEPKEYIPNLIAAVDYMASWNMSVDIYNIPLCLLPKSHWDFAYQSISDWKTKYLKICDSCSLKSKCCGLFSTSIEPYQGLEAIE